MEWDDRIGMASIDFHKGWEVGGPSALLAEWWVREHWGRAFEILAFAYHPDPWFAHDFVVMRKREVAVSAEQLEAVDYRDPREYASVACNLEILRRQQEALGKQLREAQQGRLAAEVEAQRLRDSELSAADELSRYRAELERLAGSLNVIANSRSWRLMAPLRRVRAVAGKRH
jgi:hypothetical protein